MVADSAPRAILGLAPSGRVSWCESQSYARLCEWTGARARLEQIPVVNVWRSADMAGAGRRLLVETGRADQVARTLAGHLVLSLGPRPLWLVWGLEPAPVALVRAPAVVWTIGHPSGRNRALNGPAARALVVGLVRSWLDAPPLLADAYARGLADFRRLVAPATAA